MTQPAVHYPADRRGFLKALLTGGCLGMAALPLFIRRAVAMGALPYPSGIQKMEGSVTVNGREARPGDPVAFGDTVETGPGSMVVFVVDRSVYLMRDRTRLTVAREADSAQRDTVSEVLRILNGRVLAVFNRRRDKRIFTPTAVVGVRGSAAYVEAEAHKTYLCICYGIAELTAAGEPGAVEAVKTRHHESPRYIFGPDGGTRIMPAPVINHTDAELVMLESLVFRKPPFAGDGVDGGGGY